MGISTTKMTAEQYFELGEDTDGLRRELLDGEIVMSPSAGWEHSWIVSRLLKQLQNHVDANELGYVVADLDTKIGQHDVPRPDILFFDRSKRHMLGPKRSFTVPNLAIEVLSPGNTQTDRGYKFHLYASGPISFYWIVDPLKHTFEAFELRSGQYSLVAEGNGRETVIAAPFPELGIQLSELRWQAEA